MSLDSQADFSQTVGHPVFLYLLEMPVAKISIQVEGRLTDLITQSPHALVVSHRSALFVFLCLLWPFPAKIPLPHFANASNKSNSGAADRSYSSNSTTSLLSIDGSAQSQGAGARLAGKREFPKGDRSAFREVARRTTPTSPSGRHHPGARASRPHAVPSVAAQFPCNVAADRPAGGNRMGPAEAEAGRRCRLIPVKEMAEAAGGFVRAGRPRSRVGFPPWHGHTNGTKVQKHFGASCR